jgi:hypothetical protein
MGNRCSTLTAEISPVASREVELQQQSPLVNTISARVSVFEQQPTRSRVKSAPQKVPNGDDLPPSPSQRSRTKSRFRILVVGKVRT